MSEANKKRKVKRSGVSVSEKRSKIAESWFVGKGKKNVPSAEQATFLPLVNGEAAFGELYDSIQKAKKSVEMVCWAFQPSMYFKRGVNSAGAPIGELLMERFIQDNVDVKILCWQTAPFATEKFLEDNTPGRSTLLFLHEYLAYGYFLDFLLEPANIEEHFEKLEKEKFLEPEIALHKVGSKQRHSFYKKKRSHSVEQRRFDWAWYDAVEGYNTIQNDEEFHRKMAQFQRMHDYIHGSGWGTVGTILKIKKQIGTAIDELKEFFETNLLPKSFKDLRNEWRNMRFELKEAIHYELLNHVHKFSHEIYNARNTKMGKDMISKGSKLAGINPDGSVDTVDEVRIALFNKLFEKAAEDVKATGPIHPIDQTQDKTIGLIGSALPKLKQGVFLKKPGGEGGIEINMENVVDALFDFHVVRDYVNCMNYHFLLRNEKKYPNTLAFMRLRNQGDFKSRKQKVSFVTREINPAIFPESFPFKDKGLSDLSKDILKFTPTHHQKTVMIDYEDPKSAVGFVMGHNMLDRYWDTNEHYALPDEYKTYTTSRDGPGEVDEHSKLENIDESQMRGRNPSAGAFFGTPRQDVSCKLTGKVLYDIDANFVQGWNKALQDNGYYRIEHQPITPTERVKREQFKPRRPQENKEGGEPLFAQILRTQPEYQEDNVHALYEQNFKMATSYIYFENQYFRFPPFGEALRNGFKERKEFAASRGIDTTHMQPLCVFVVTNSSQEGLGPGVVNTDRMLEALGRRDVMPSVARERILEQAGYGNKIQRMFPNLPADSIWRKILPDYILPPPPLKPIQGLNEREVKNRELAEKVKKTKDVDELREILKEDLEKEGIKVHICTLVAEDWEEIYIHSKLCLINDTFATLGSTNINTRSMQIDSELNVAIESQPVAHKMRYDIWDWHTGGQPVMNPSDQLIDPAISNEIFDIWTHLLQMNKEMKESEQLRMMPLLEFDLTDVNKVPTVDWD
ncbi:phospholipase D-like domain-containing protein [Neisseria sp. Dent CA1/247]|uniref:phospholipase D-like domain-containing protein n=1 Tax=Neisseria sp. Dent CA1/247 TaxID=2912675 RepID=UPI001FD55223|nr:phospholipase D-like domain-containing protein [Neisseria sp. Dent CA1/247]UOO77088.1 phospholipase D-like domain-containing protein [Neisseria sp. Dent CA1/247]